MTSWIKTFDRPIPRALSMVPSAIPVGYSPGGGTAIDYRNDQTRNPNVFTGMSTSGISKYSPVVDGFAWQNAMTLSNVANRLVFTPRGPRGTINATGATTSSFALTTALPGTLGANMGANRGDGVGYRIRVIGLTAGKVEERNLIANTESTTPTVYLDAPLTFTPASGDQYEFLSGTVFGATSTTWTSYDVLTGTIVAKSATTMPTINASYYDTCFAQSEMYVPWDRTPGEGFIDSGATYMGGSLRCIQATASSSTTITADALSGSISLFTNEYVNMQVRIVEDSGTPGAVGQRGRITGHTSGNTPVFTTATWGTTPSASAKFVIEQDDDKIIQFPLLTTVATYNITANTWSTSVWSAAGSTRSYGGQAFPYWGMSRDPSGVVRQSMWLVPRGGNTGTWDVFDTANGSTGTWTSAVAVHPSMSHASSAWLTGSLQSGLAQIQPNVFTDGGKFVYFVGITASANPLAIYRINIRERYMETVCTIPSQATGIASGRFRYVHVAFNGREKLASFGFLHETARSVNSALTFFEHWCLDLLMGGGTP